MSTQKKVFQSTLISIGENVLENKNANATKYNVATIEFKLANGTTVQRSARVYHGNLFDNEGNVRMKEGGSYLTTATMYTDAEGKPAVDIVVSHLTSAARATASEFELFEGTTVEEEGVVGRTTARPTTVNG